MIEKIVSTLLKEYENSSHLFVSGAPSILLALAYYRQFHAKKSIYTPLDNAINGCIDICVESIESHPMDTSLYYGLSGICYALKSSSRILEKKILPDTWFKQLDKVVEQSLEFYFQNSDFDLLRGSAGVVSYMTHYYPKRKSLKTFIKKLKAFSKTDGKGNIFWGSFTFDEVRNVLEYSENVYNLGLAHGACSVIAVLSELYRLDILANDCYHLIEGSINFLNSQKSFEGNSIFPGKVTDNGGVLTREESRLGWCYGDVSTALTLLKAGKYCENPLWCQQALEIGGQTLARNSDNAYLEEHGLCHGYLGAAHLYNRMYKETRQKSYKSRMNYWIRKSAGEVDPSVGSTGLYCSNFNRAGVITRSEEPGFLQGLSGMLLSLLSAKDGIAFPWDRVLLVNIE